LDSPQSANASSDNPATNPWSAGNTGLVPAAHWTIEEGAELAPGPFGRIFSANYRNRHLAARQIRRDALAGDALTKLTVQAATLTTLVHRNLLQVVGLCIDLPPDVYVLTAVRAQRERRGRGEEGRGGRERGERSKTRKRRRLREEKENKEEGSVPKRRRLREEKENKEEEAVLLLQVVAAADPDPLRLAAREAQLRHPVRRRASWLGWGA